MSSTSPQKLAPAFGGRVRTCQLCRRADGRGDREDAAFGALRSRRKKGRAAGRRGHTISTESYLDRILQVISEMVAETFDAPVCSIMIVDRGQAGAVDPSRALFVAGVPAEAADSNRRFADRPGRSRAAAGDVPDVADEKLYKYPELARRTGLTSLFPFPSCWSESHRHISTSTRASTDRLQSEEIGFANAVAGQAALAFENARPISESVEMKRTLEARKIIERAKGILQHRHA